MRFALLALLLLASPLASQQPAPTPPAPAPVIPPAAITLTGPEGKVAPGKLIRICAKTAGK